MDGFCKTDRLSEWRREGKKDGETDGSVVRMHDDDDDKNVRGNGGKVKLWFSSTNV